MYMYTSVTRYLPLPCGVTVASADPWPIAGIEGVTVIFSPSRAAPSDAPVTVSSRLSVPRTGGCGDERTSTRSEPESLVVVVSASAGKPAAAGPGGELVEVATRRPDPGMRVHRGGDQPRIGPGGSAVQAGCGALQVVGVQVAPPRDHPHQHARPGRHHERAGCGADQHQPPAPRPLEGREMLCDPAAPGDAEHVDRVVAER